MKKRLFTFLAAIALACAMIAPAQADFHDYWADVYTWDGRMSLDGKPVLTKATSGITYVVMAINEIDDLETLYYYNNDAYTSLANPVTGTNFASDTISGDRVAFRCDPTDSTSDRYVDLIVVDQAGGYTAFIEDFDYYTHSIIIDERMNVRHHGVAFIYTTTSSTETDTGIDFDDTTIIDKMMIEVGTAFPTNCAISVGILSTGTNGDADGFIVSEGLATVGWNDPLRSGVDLTSYSVTSSEQGGIINDPSAGTWLAHIFAGTGDTETLLAESIYYPSQLLIHGTWENSLTYILPLIAADTGWGMIHFWFTRVR